MLIDHMMPELSGIETTRLLKEQPRFAHLPILIVTAKNDRQTLRDAFDAGAVDYILKPVEKTTLLARINSAIRTKKPLIKFKNFHRTYYNKNRNCRISPIW